MSATLDSLPPMKRAVMWRVGRGLTDKEIAAELGIGVRTVKEHLWIARNRLGLELPTRVQLAMWVWEQQGRLGPEPTEWGE